MGILADIGRSNLGQVSQNILGEMNQFARTQSLTQLEDIEAKKRGMEVAEMQKQAEEFDRPRDIRSSVWLMGLPEEEREPFVQRMIKSGYADQNGVTSLRKRNMFFTELGKSEEGLKFLTMPKIMQARQQMEQFVTKYNTAVMSGDEEAIAKAEKNMKAGSIYLSTLEGHANAALSALSREDVAKERADAAKQNAQLRADTAKEIAEGRRQSAEEIAKTRYDATTEAAKIRADAAMTVAEIRAEQAKERVDKAKEGKELQKRNAVHREVEKIFGISEFLESAKDPELRRNYGEVAAFSDEVSRNPVGYGLKENAGEAEIAKKAYDIWAMMSGRKQSGAAKPKTPLQSFEGKK